jgi:hypothetical protein
MSPPGRQDAAHFETGSTAVRGGSEWPSTDYLGTQAVAAPFESPLPEPVGEVQDFALAEASPLAIWRFVARQASDAGLGSSQTDDMVVSVVAASESLAQGGDHGTLRIWRDLEALICEVRYPGRGPSPGGQGGGLWVANQLCDLVEPRSFRTGAVARLRMVA